MWTITSYYNPIRYRRRLSNYRSFHERLTTPLVAVELSFDGDFELNRHDADVLIQIRGGAIVWQKERLLNLAIRAVPHGTEDVAWIDCDVIFGRTDWVVEAKEQLATFNVVQLYSDVFDPPPDSVVYRNNPRSSEGVISVMSQHPSEGEALVERGRDVGGASMGLAWAARDSDSPRSRPIRCNDHWQRRSALGRHYVRILRENHGRIRDEQGP